MSHDNVVPFHQPIHKHALSRTEEPVAYMLPVENRLHFCAIIPFACLPRNHAGENVQNASHYLEVYFCDIRIEQGRNEYSIDCTLREEEATVEEMNAWKRYFHELLCIFFTPLINPLGEIPDGKS